MIEGQGPGDDVIGAYLGHRRVGLGADNPDALENYKGRAGAVISSPGHHGHLMPSRSERDTQAVDVAAKATDDDWGVLPRQYKHSHSRMMAQLLPTAAARAWNRYESRNPS